MSNFWNDLCKAVFILRSLPKSLWFNFYYLPFKQAIRLPVLVSHRLKLRYLGGSIQVDAQDFASVKLGFNSLGVISGSGDGIWNVRGHIHFKGKAHIGCHPMIQIEGNLTLGDHFDAGHHLKILCQSTILIDADVLCSWNVEIMDHDAHLLLDAQQQIINPARPIHIGKQCWIGSHCSLLKGSVLADHSILASQSLLNKAFHKQHCLLAGMPAKEKKQDMYWRIS